MEELAPPVVPAAFEKSIKIDLTVEQHRRLRVAAALEHRSLSAQVRKVLGDWLDTVDLHAGVDAIDNRKAAA